MENKKIKQIQTNLPTVVLFGRTNVGKSTLFNKLSGKSQAIVSKIPGTTRDSNFNIVDWQGKKFQLIDTGGILNTKFLVGKSKLKKINFDKDDVDNLVQLQVKDWLKKADLILFTVDNKTGLTAEDRQMVILLKRLIAKKQKISLVANKVDNFKEINDTSEFYQLALGEPIPVSAATGSGTGDLLDKIVTDLKLKKNTKSEISEQEQINVIILGKPNAGKSSLVNAIIGEQKIIVSEEAHTTREPKDFQIEYQDKILNFVDTAGIIKRKSKVAKQELVKLGIQKSLDSIKKADVALLVLDIAEDISHQETKIANEILKEKVNLIIVANKWDQIEEKETKKYSRYIYSKFPFLQWAQIIFLSAKNKTKIRPLLNLIVTTNDARNKKISEEDLAEFLQSARAHAKPLANKKVRGILKHKIPKPKLISIKQTYINPQEFTLQIKSKMGLKDNYIKYIENRLREKFGLIGTPVEIKISHK